MAKDADIINAAMGFRVGICGKGSRLMCAAVCLPLVGYLSWEFGIDAKIIETLLDDDLPCHTHLWIELPDGRALDPTVDQFDSSLPPVYLGEPIPRYHVDADVRAEAAETARRRKA